MSNQSGLIRRVFPGSNTPRGFYSYYQHMLPQERAVRTFILKGGPGVGKSTFLKRIGEAMETDGFEVEYHHCSADNESLDGVVLPEIGVALLDGTAPHVVDPVCPGAIDEIVNFGSFWDEQGIRTHRRAIIAVNEALAECFSRCFRYLAAARAVYDDLEAAHRPALNFGGLNQIGATLIEELQESGWASSRPGRLRRLFGSAITPDGSRNYLDTLIVPWERIVVVKGEPGTGKATLVEKVARALLEQGFDVEAFHCPFDPERMEHLVVPGLKLAVTTSAAPHLWEGCAGLVVDTGDAVDESVLARQTARIKQARAVYESLFDQAVGALADAKALHDELESYYVPYMDFRRIDPLFDRVRGRIQEYAAMHRRTQPA